MRCGADLLVQAKQLADKLLVQASGRAQAAVHHAQSQPPS